VVLLVDDERRNRALVRAMVGDRWSLLEAENGPDALTIVDREAVDLVLLDVMMPGMSGHEVCRRLKARAAAAGEYLPVLMLTALDSQEDRNQGLEAGADDFLSKPINRKELILRIGTFLRLRDQERTNRKQVQELKAFDALKDELVSLFVHDLRNPLSGIVGVLDLMSGSVTDPLLQHDLQGALAASDKLREILEDLLQVRLLENRAIVLRREPVSANLLLDDAIRSVAGAARIRDVQIVRMADAGDLRVEADPKLVRRAIENLLANAVKHAPDGSEVQAVAHQVDEGVEIEIADRGAGVPEPLKGELFKRFGSVEAARGHARRGYGLGLYLVNLVATAHGGRASVRDRAGGGAAFGLLLPKPLRAPASALGV
jgi:two-component system sensor histidine kinase/response regulator